MDKHFDKTRRLLTKKQYAYVFENAKKLAIPDFVVIYRPNTVGIARLGLAVSKKAVPKAHDRNRIKRLVRETFRLSSALPSVDIVVMTKPHVVTLTNARLITTLHQAWNRLCATNEQ